MKVRAAIAESAEQSLKNSRFQLEYAEEELKQLQQMYEADDLTEETEEIILRRAQRSVESARFSLKSSEIGYERTLQRELPLELLRLKEAADRRDQALSRTRIRIPIALEKKRLDVTKLHATRDWRMRSWLTCDATWKAMTIVAPATVRLLRTVRAWQVAGCSEICREVAAGRKPTPNQTIMTIVTLQPLLIRLDVAEKDRPNIKSGLSALAVPTGAPEHRLDAQVASISPVPIAPACLTASCVCQTRRRTCRSYPE